MMKEASSNLKVPPLPKISRIAVYQFVIKTLINMDNAVKSGVSFACLSTFW
jgi:hypothetical protein